MTAYNQKPIVLYCHNDYATTRGGEYNVYVSDVDLLEKEGYKVIRYERNNTELINANVIKKVLFILSSFFNFGVYNEITKLVVEEKIQYAFVQNTFLIFSPAIYIALYKKKIPIIQMVYNYRFMCANAHLYTKGKVCEKCIGGSHYNAVINKCLRNSFLISLWYALILYIIRKVLTVDKKVSAFVVPDEFSKLKHVQSFIAKEKIFVAKNPFKVEKVEANEDDGSFLFIGRLIRQKGVYTFLNSALKLRDEKFRIIGEGEEEKSIREFIRSNKLTNVELLGVLHGEQMTRVLRKARALIVPSEWYDNYPVVISFAYNYSKPVIASNINGLPEVVIDHRTGLLFEPENVEQLCEKIQYLSANLPKAKEMGQDGKLFLMNELNDEKRIRVIKEVLRTVKAI